MGNMVRIGKISTIDYGAGTASVAYTDCGNEVSPQFPLLSTCYEMPKVGETVVVIMLSNSRTRGFIAGRPFGCGKPPVGNGQGVFYKKFLDGTEILYDPEKKTLAIAADKIMLQSVTARDVVVEGSLRAGSIEAETVEAGGLTAGSIVVTGTARINNLAVTGMATGNFPI